MGNSRYTDLWRRYRPVILRLIRIGGGHVQLCETDFTSRDSGGKYAFSMIIQDCIIPELTENTVALDLREVLLNSEAFLSNAANRIIIIRMTPSFLLEISIVKELPGDQNSMDVEKNKKDMANYREQFKEFLRQDHFTENGTIQMLDALTSVVDYYIKLLANPEHTTVLELSDIDKLTLYLAILSQNTSFINANRMKGRRPRSAFLEYLAFAKSLNAKMTEGLPVETKAEPSQIQETNSVKNDVSVVKVSRSKLNKEQVYIEQAKEVIQPIKNYLIEHNLLSLIVFEYRGLNQDVDVLRPVFKRDLHLEEKEIGQMVFLMTKYGLQIPSEISKRRGYLKEQIGLCDTIRAFENWLVSYMVYLKLDLFDIYSMHYSAETGFSISCIGVNSTLINIVVKNND